MLVMSNNSFESLIGIICCMCYAKYFRIRRYYDLVVLIIVARIFDPILLIIFHESDACLTDACSAFAR